MKLITVTISVCAAWLALVGAASANLDLSRERLVIDVAGGVEEACDEPILLTGGQVTETIQVFDDPSGKTHFLWRVRSHGIEGVGLVSGAEYRDQTIGTQTGTGEIAEGFGTSSFTVRVKIWSQSGTVATLLFTQRFHIVKRDGVNILVRDDVSFSCD